MKIKIWGDINFLLHGIPCKRNFRLDQLFLITRNAKLSKDFDNIRHFEKGHVKSKRAKRLGNNLFSVRTPSFDRYPLLLCYQPNNHVVRSIYSCRFMRHHDDSCLQGDKQGFATLDDSRQKL